MCKVQVDKNARAWAKANKERTLDLQFKVFKIKSYDVPMANDFEIFVSTYHREPSHEENCEMVYADNYNFVF